MRLARTTLAALVAAGVLVGLPAQADGQQERFFVEARGGIADGLGDVGFIGEYGPTFGASVGYWIHDRIALTVGGDATLLSGADRDVSPEAAADEQRVFIDVPDIDLYHYGAGVEILATPRESPLEVRFGGGIGGTTIQTDAFPADFVAALPERVRAPDGGEFETTDLSIDGRLQVGYDVTERVNVFAGTRAYLSFLEETDTEFFHQAVEEADPQGFDTAWDLPIHAGVKIGF